MAGYRNFSSNLRSGCAGCFGLFFVVFFSTSLWSKPCSESLALLDQFKNQKALSFKEFDILEEWVDFEGMSKEQAAQFKLRVRRLAIRLLKDPIESEYFDSFFESRFSDWNGFEQLLNERPALLLTLFRLYRRFRLKAGAVFQKYEENYPGSLQVASLQENSWNQMMSLYEYLYFFERLQESRERRDQKELAPNSRRIVFDSNIYVFEARDFLFGFLSEFRSRLGEVKVLSVPQVLLEIGDHFRNRENEFQNLYPGFTRKLTAAEIEEYQSLVSEIHRLRLITDPSSNPTPIPDDRIVAQALMVGAEFFVTADRPLYHRLVDHPREVPQDPKTSHLHLDSASFRMRKIKIQSPRSKKIYQLKIVAVAASGDFQRKNGARDWRQTFSELPRQRGNPSWSTKTPGREAVKDVPDSLPEPANDHRNPSRTPHSGARGPS